MIYPSEIILEVTNRCNLKCRYCHFHGNGAVRKRKLGDMPENIWRKVLSEIEFWSGEAEFVALCFHGAGEPLLHPELKRILAEARSIQNASIGFMTNGMLLDKTWSEFLVSLPVDWIWFSIDGASPEVNDFYRVGAKLSLIERNIETLIEIKDKFNSHLPALNFNMVLYPDVEKKHVDSYIRKWLPCAEQIAISRFRPIPSKKLLTEEERIKIPYRPCPLLYRQLVISWDGKIGLCCEDINFEVTLGHIETDKLIEVFNGRVIRSIRSLHESGMREKVHLCRECDVWSSDEILEKSELDVCGFKVEVLKRPSGTIYRKTSW